MASNYNWSELHPDLLVEIARRVKLYNDFISFGQVCRSWRSAAVLENFRYKTNQIPWLMLPPEKDCNDVSSFFSLSNGTSVDVIMPSFNSSKYYSSRGWLIKLDQDLRVSLLHPFSRAELKLPPISTAEYWIDDGTIFACCITKCVLSSSGQDSSPVVMVIYGGTGQLAYAKPGDEVWTSVNSWNHLCLDVIFHQVQFYAINILGEIFAIKGDITQKVAEMPKPNGFFPPHKVAGMPMPNGFFPRSEFGRDYFEYIYLVESESDGALLMVSREGVQTRLLAEGSNEWTYGTSGFQVFEVDLRSNNWKEIKNLGHRSLFLGHNSSLWIDASNDPYCKRNCIYFTDDYVESYDFMYEEGDMDAGGKDMGIYNVKDGLIVPHYKGKSYHVLNPPMWVEQTPNS